MAKAQTAAGRQLLESLSNLAADLPLEFGDEPLERLDIEATSRLVVSIEAEAAAAALVSEGYLGGLYRRARRRIFIRSTHGPSLMGRLVVDGPHMAIVVPWADQEQAETYADELRDGGRIERRIDD